MISRRTLIGSALCLSSAGLAAAMPTPEGRPIDKIDLAGATPLSFGRWRTDGNLQPVLPDENEQRTIAQAYDQSFSRVYRREDGAVVMLVIAHGGMQTGMLAIHRPATCYTAQGFTAMPRVPERLPAPFADIAAERMFAVRDERQEPILFWMTIAGRQTGFGLAQNLAVLRAAWQGEPAEGFLIRASTFGPDRPDSYRLLAEFMADLLTAVPPALRHRLSAAPAVAHSLSGN
ncbi:EpsI family protein [Sphingomonas oleivorans]|uniref:EpsI family protein n=1 Tax=Sphingomonas oleivorans TaxID=1735121 RepID=A0A2T5G073_9SPHN|nr:exosortase C-terminal domain/associated protein EpsI [Sphingomonas oleivorans]PTQ12344.1 EpsI family protein [Sphingomonas oleivorans]